MHARGTGLRLKCVPTQLCRCLIHILSCVGNRDSFVSLFVLRALYMKLYRCLVACTLIMLCTPGDIQLQIRVGDRKRKSYK